MTQDPATRTDIVYRAGLLLVCSNVFMTFAWYAHLRNLADRPWWIAALVSWGIALFEYLLQVPANRIGYTAFSLAQLKILQEVITLAVFVPFAVLYMRQPVRLDFLWAALCLVAVLEGLMLFVAPAGWQRMAARMQELDPRQLRIGGAVMIVLGLVSLQVVRG